MLAKWRMGGFSTKCYLPRVCYKTKQQLITMSTEEKKELTQMEASKRKVQKETPYYVLLEPDPSLNKYINKVLFPKKLDLANKALSLSGAPKI